MEIRLDDEDAVVLRLFEIENRYLTGDAKTWDDVSFLLRLVNVQQTKIEFLRSQVP